MCNSRFPINFWMQIEECWYWIHPSVRSLIWRLFDHQILVIWTLHTQFFLFPIFCFVMDRPFNLKGGGEGLWVFVSFRIFFSDNRRVRIFIYFVAQSAKFFSRIPHQVIWQRLWIRLLFFASTKIRIFFFSNIGNQNIFLEKNHNPPSPLQDKWSFPYH
jgi:hypothetical protein